jgi:tetraacyldisaccharide 4'-kinase
LGEGRIAAGLIQELRKSWSLPILRSCTSEAARETKIGADATAYLPFDSPFLVGAALDRIRPRILILVEGELWPALILACAARKIPVWVVAARVGPGTLRLARLPGVWKQLSACWNWVPVDEAAARLGGGEPIGDLKGFEGKQDAGIHFEGSARPVLIGACTYAEEEPALIQAFLKLSPEPMLILAPRRPERFDAVASFLETKKLRFIRRTRLKGGIVPAQTQVLLLDTVGELAALYPLAGAAFIGGSFVERIGGHSPSEAAAAGCPVVHGPHILGNAAGFKDANGILCENIEELAASLKQALHTPRSSGIPLSTRLEPLLARFKPALSAPMPLERPLRPWLWPLSWLWFLAAVLRPRPLHTMSVPVIAVGALTAGGSGKTPVAGWLAAWFQAKGIMVAVVGRGYGRNPGNEVRVGKKQGESPELGDELAMLARRGCLVVSSPDREAGVQEAVRQGAKLVILDDALQNGAVARNLEIVVIDARWPEGGGMIPVGSRRVPVSWLKKADVIWVNHGPFPEALKAYARPDAIVVEAEFLPEGWVRRGSKVEQLPKKPAVALAGIAHPEGFFRLVRATGVEPVKTWSYPDHHRFIWTELQTIEAWLDEYCVLTTEKDAARLPSDLGIHYLQLELSLKRGDAELQTKLAALLQSAIP